MTLKQVKTPWIAHLGDVPAHLDYFEGSMYEAVEKIANQYPNYIAFDFMGRSTTYKRMIEDQPLCEIPAHHRCASGRQSDNRNAQLSPGGLYVLRGQPDRCHREHDPSPFR